MNRWLAASGLVIVIVGAGLSVGLWQRARVSGTALNAAEHPAGVPGVEAFMKNSKRSQGTVWVEGVVSASSPQKQMFALIDTKEFEECGVATCAPLTLPVRWMGLLPRIRERVWVQGQVEEIDGKLVFVARRVQRESPKGDTVR